MSAKKPTVTPEEVTNPQIEEKKTETATDHGKNSEVAASPPQTDLEIASDEAAIMNAPNSIKETIGEDAVILQTGSDQQLPASSGFEDAENSGGKNSSHQTDAETSENLAPEPPADEEAAETPKESQTEPKKAKRTKKRKKVPEDSENQSDKKPEKAKKEEAAS